MDELEQIRMKKLQKMQTDALNSQLQQELALQQQVEQIESAVKQSMTKEAVSRYGNIKAANPEKAIQTLVVMARALETRQITQINDDLLKHFLGALTPQKRKMSIKRV